MIVVTFCEPGHNNGFFFFFLEHDDHLFYDVRATAGTYFILYSGAELGIY